MNLLQRSGLGLEELGQLRQMQSQTTYSQELSAEDAVAQTYADVWRELPGLRELDRFEAWLFRIAHNRALDVIKRRGGEQADPSDELVAPSLADPAEELLRRERATVLGAAILELPDDQREVVVLRLLRDLSHAEVGRQTGRSEAASRVMLHRALQSLRAALRASEPASQGAGA